MGMVAEATHRLGLAAHTRPPGLVEPLRLDHGDCHISVEPAIVSQVNALSPALAKEALDLVAAFAEGRTWSYRWLDRRSRRSRGRRCGLL